MNASQIGTCSFPRIESRFRASGTLTFHSIGTSPSPTIRIIFHGEEPRFPEPLTVDLPPMAAQILAVSWARELRATQWRPIQKCRGHETELLIIEDDLVPNRHFDSRNRTVIAADPLNGATYLRFLADDVSMVEFHFATKEVSSSSYGELVERLADIEEAAKARLGLTVGACSR